MLTNHKKTLRNFVAYPFFQILQILKTPLFIQIIPITNHHKHKAKYIVYIVYVTIFIIIFFFFLLFIKKISLYKKKFSQHTDKIFFSNIRILKQGIYLFLKELKLIARHGNIRDYKNKSAKDLRKALRGPIPPRLEIKKDMLKEVTEDFHNLRISFLKKM